MDIGSDVEWSIADSTVASVSNGILKALKEGTTTIEAQYKGKTSDTLSVSVYKEINGYRLPPEPNPTVNNSTLLGVDSNGNGVRDDVERWIYQEYKDKHPIHIDIAMQAGRAYKLVLETPEKAKEIHNEVSAAGDCEAYYRIYAKYFNEPLLIKHEVTTKYFRKIIYFNTKDRMDTYIQYDTLLSGDTYSTPAVDKNMSSYCDFNTIKYEE